MLPVGALVEVNCENVTIKEGEVDIGANASAEEQAEALEDGASTVSDILKPLSRSQPHSQSHLVSFDDVQVNNLVHTFRLAPTSFDKKTYMTYLKGYMKAVKAHLAATKPERVEAFEKGAQEAAKKILANFKDYEFYVGESMNPDGSVHPSKTSIPSPSWKSILIFRFIPSLITEWSHY
ncbi:hypothetical protein PSHT_13554 [Puccinia striiformis]|uniref:Translationally-controlled tumor protein homolog n=1 Tax=Puccinia striiformis TaxID=27350 RepID=A0A2S4UQ51_9BASI|nr:hypothetical protein PSHT_13554 [Puccinia striiformis]